MTIAELAGYASAVDGLLDFAVAALIYAELRRMGATTSRTGAALLAYFVLSGLHELTERGPLLPYSPVVDLAMTLGLAVVLLAILPLARSFARGLAATHRRAEYQVDEYARARRHYEQLVRHRLFNPLSVVRGAAETMKSRPELEPAVREQLLDSIIDAAHRIEGVSLHAASDSPEEHDLDARPGDDT